MKKDNLTYVIIGGFFVVMLSVFVVESFGLTSVYFKGRYYCPNGTIADFVFIPPFDFNGSSLYNISNITAEYYYGSGKYLTDITCNGTGNFTGYWINQGDYLQPNSTAADNVYITGYVNVTGNVMALKFLGEIDCSNITGATSDLCTLVDTDTTCAVDGSCGDIFYESEASAYKAVADANFINTTELNYTQGLPIINITNLDGSKSCTGTDKVINVTVTNTGLSIVCASDEGGTEGDPLWAANASDVWDALANRLNRSEFIESDPQWFNNASALSDLLHNKLNISDADISFVNTTELNYTQNLPIVNVTNLDGSKACSGTDKIINVTITDSGLSIVCSEDIQGAGTATAGSHPWLFNDSSTMDFNESYLNDSLDAKGYLTSYTESDPQWNGNASAISDSLHNKMNISDADAAFLNVTDQRYNETGWALATFLNKSYLIKSPNCSVGQYVTNVTISETGGLVITCDSITATEGDPLWSANASALSDLLHNKLNISDADISFLNVSDSVLFYNRTDFTLMNSSESVKFYNVSSWSFINASLLEKSPNCPAGQYVINVTITSSGGLTITCDTVTPTEGDPLWAANASDVWDALANRLNLSIADTNFLNVSGDTATGIITFNTNTTNKGNYTTITGNKLCTNSDCSTYIYNNGTHTIIK